MKTIGVSELKAHCLSIVDDVAKKGTSVLISKRGKVVARIVPALDVEAEHPQDLLAGTVSTVGDVLGPLIPESDWNMLAAPLKPRARKARKRA